MGPGFYIIAILGCADGSASCAPVATMPTRYESEAACAAATADVLSRNSDFDFPTIMAECRKSAVRAAAPKAEAERSAKEAKAPRRVAARALNG